MKVAKKMKIFTMSLLLTVAVVPSASASPSQSPSQVLEEATQVATDYFKSYISKDIEGRIKNSVEPIYSNDTERRAAYEQQAKTDTPVTDFKIVESTEVSDSEVDLSVVLTTADAVLPPIPYEVKKVEKDWKVVLVPQEINVDKSSPDYGKVTPIDVENRKYMDTSGIITPFARTLDYYYFENWDGYALEGQDTFNITQNWVSVQGYQSDDAWVGSSSNFYVKYEIITGSGNNVLWYGQKTINGFYYQDRQYYGIINLTQNSITNAKIRVSSNGSRVYGAGNVYENE